MARFGGQETSRSMVSKGEDVLSDLHADFRRSKVELIQRFLQDQVELNKKFSEYALNSDEEFEEGQGSGGQGQGRPHRLDPVDAPCLMLEDLEDVDEADWDSDVASVASAVASSVGSDAERDKIALSDDDLPLRSRLSPDPSARSSRLGFGDSYWPAAHSNNSKVSNTSALPRTENVRHALDNTAENRKSPKSKAKKVLVKKNIRAKTAVGVRSILLDKDDLDVLSSPTLEDGIKCPPTSPSPGDPSPVFCNSNMLPLSSNRTNSSPQPWWEGLGYSRLPFDKTTLNNLYDPLNTSGYHFTHRNDASRDRNSGSLTQRHRVSSHPPGQNALIPHPGSSFGNKNVLSIDIPPSGRRSRSSIEDDGALVTVRPTLSARGHPGKRVLVKAPMSAPLKNAMSKSSKRPIAVLKLPPLDSGPGNRGVSDQQALVKPANKGPVVSSTEFLAG